MDDYSASPAYRTPPHNIEAEQALLGAILVNNETVGRVSEFLLAEHFFEPLHQRIYEHAVKLIERQQIANPVSLRPFFESDPAMVEIGGPAYLARLAANAVTIINAGDYGRAIYDHAVKRQLIQVGEEIVNTAYEADIDNPAEDQIQAAEGKLFALATTGRAEAPSRFACDLMLAEIQTARRRAKTGVPAGLSIGLHDLDSITGGFTPGDLIILAGRPSMGKTALATNIARAAAVGGTGSVFFSAEMGAAPIAARMLAESAFRGPGSPSYQGLRAGTLNDSEMRRLEQSAAESAGLPLIIDDVSSPTISTLRARARRAGRLLERRNSPLGLVVVDYLQLVRSSDRYRGDKTRETSEVSAALKALAMELGVPVIALSQLSRQVEAREDKRPQLSDLRDSGSIEQDADVVMFVFREEYYLSRNEPADPVKALAWQARLAQVQNTAQIAIAKNRNGGIGVASVFFDAPSGAFRDLAP